MAQKVQTADEKYYFNHSKKNKKISKTLVVYCVLIKLIKPLIYSHVIV